MMNGRQMETGQAVAPAGAWSMPNIDPRQLLSSAEASAFLMKLGIGLASKTLANLRCVGGGPSFWKNLNGQIRYSAVDLQEFARSRLCFRGDSTSNLKPVT